MTPYPFLKLNKVQIGQSFYNVDETVLKIGRSINIVTFTLEVSLTEADFDLVTNL